MAGPHESILAIGQRLLRGGRRGTAFHEVELPICSSQQQIRKRTILRPNGRAETHRNLGFLTVAQEPLTDAVSDSQGRLHRRFGNDPRSGRIRFPSPSEYVRPGDDRVSVVG